MEALLVTTKRNIDILKDCCEGLMYSDDVSCLRIVCPEDQVSYFRNYIQKNNMSNIKVTNEENILPHSVKSYIIAELGENQHRSNWYYQQFLKWHSILLQCDKDVLIWDADTVPLRKLKFKEKGRYYLTSAREHHKPYFQLINSLFPEVKLQKKSFISQHQIVNKDHLNLLCDVLGGSSGAIPEYIVSIMTNIDKNVNSSFSEYETYANFVLHNFPRHYIPVSKNWFRGGNDVLKVSDASKRIKWFKRNTKFEFVAFEFHKRTVLKSMIAITKICLNWKIFKRE